MLILEKHISNLIEVDPLSSSYCLDISIVLSFLKYFMDLAALLD